MPKDSDYNPPKESEIKFPVNGGTENGSFVDFINKNRVSFLIALIGLIFTGFGVFLYLNTDIFESDKVEVINGPSEAEVAVSEIVVEIAGAVEKPGVYKLANGSRVEDLLISCGGLSAQADRNWVEKYVNRAAKLADSQKVYIFSIEESLDQSQDKQTTTTSAKNEGGYQTISPVLGTEIGGLLNINSASFEELDKLPGIGQVYGTKIIEQRPYSNTEELLTKGILPKTIYEKIKNLITAF